MVGTETIMPTQDLVDNFVTVDTDAVCAAIKDAFEDTRSIWEPCRSYDANGHCRPLKHSVAQHLHLKGDEIWCSDLLTEPAWNSDRRPFVARTRSGAGEEREALFAVTIPEERGSFKRLCETIGQRNVTEFSYRISDEREAHVLVGHGLHQRSQ